MNTSKRYINPDIKRVLEENKTEYTIQVFVVHYEHYLKDHDVEVLDIYMDQEKANRRVKWERELIQSNPEERFRDECWYKEKEVIL